MVEYEWLVEFTDEHGNIDLDHLETLDDISRLKEEQFDLVLVRRAYNGSCTEIYWAYVKNNQLPEFFSDSAHIAGLTKEPTNIRVPKKYLQQLFIFVAANPWIDSKLIERK